MVNSRRGGRSTAAKVEQTGGDASGKGDNGYRKGKGEKGAGKGKGEGKKGGVKGVGKGKKGEGKSASTFQTKAAQQDQYQHVSGAKTVQELEAEMLNGKGGAGSMKERREAVKQPLEGKGNFCEVKKHSDMGCAVVTFADSATRDAVYRLVEEKPENKHRSEDTEKARKGPSIKVSGVDVQCRPHFDKAKQEEMKDDIFVAWGRQNEKLTPLAASTIVDAMDLLVIEARGGQLTLTPEAMPLPQSLSQMLQAPMVPGPQQQQHNDAYQMQEMMKLVWAQQQALAQQQGFAAAASQQMQPPPSPQPTQHGTSPSILETPPRSGNGNKMRAEAAVFTPPPTQFTESQYLNLNELDHYGDYGYTASPAKKPFAIVNPTSGQAIEVPKLPDAPKPSVQGFEPTIGRKPVKIVDPNSKQTIDTLGMICTPPKAAKFTIIDPSSGSPVQAA